MFPGALNIGRYSRFFVIGATAIQHSITNNNTPTKVSTHIWQSNDNGNIIDYTKSFDIALHELERSCPMLIDDKVSSSYIRKCGEWHSRFKKISKNNQIIFAKNDGNIIGVYGNVQCRVKNHFLPKNSDTSIAVDYGLQLRVSPYYRRNGIASKIIDTQIKNRYSDSKLSYVHIGDGNYKSINLFQRKGYKIVAQLDMNVSMPSINRIKYIKQTNLISKTENKYIYNINGNYIVIERIQDETEVVNLWRNRFNDYGLLPVDAELYDLAKSKEFKGIYKAYNQENKDNDTEFAMVGLYNESEIQYPIITKCSFKLKISTILSSYFSKNGKIDLLNAIRYLFKRLEPENDPFDLCKFAACRIFGGATNCDENDNLLYKILIEFVEQESLNQYNASIVQHLYCKMDGDIFKNYIKSIVGIQVCLLFYFYNADDDDDGQLVLKQIIPNNAKIWYDPRL